MKQQKKIASIILTSFLTASTVLSGVGIVSEPIIAKAEEVEGFKLLTDIKPIHNDGENVLTGKLSKTATVDVRVSVVENGKPVDKSVLKDGQAVKTNAQGEFTVTIKQQAVNTKVVFVFTDDAAPKNVIKKEMTVLAKNAPEFDTTAPIIHTVGDIVNSSRIVTGTVSEPGTVTASIGDKSIGSVSVVEANKQSNGEYAFSIILDQFHSVGTTISLQATDLAKPTPFKSTVTNIPVINDTSKPILETPIKEVSEKSKVVEGKLNKPATIELIVDEKQLTASPTATDIYGNFKITIPEQKSGTKIKVIATDYAKNKLETEVVVQDKTAPVVKVNDVFATSNYIKGEVSEKATILIQEQDKTAGNWVTVVSDLQTDDKNKFAYKLNEKLAIGTKLQIVAQDESNNKSELFKVTVKEDKTAPLLSSDMVDIGNNEDTVFKGQLTEEGTVEATMNGSSVLLTKDELEVDKVSTDDDGNFEVKIKKQAANTKITFTFTDIKGNSSKRIATVKDLESASVLPKITITHGVKNSSRVVTGQVNKPGIVTVTLGNKSIGTATIKEGTKPDVDSGKPEERRYNFKAVLDKNYAVDEVLTIQLKDYSTPNALESDVINLFVENDDDKPKLDGEFVISDAMSSVTGKLDKPGKVQLFVGDKSLHSNSVATDEEGNFKISIKKQVTGTEINIKMEDLVGNKEEVTTTVVDKTSPDIKKIESVYNTSEVIKGQISEASKVSAQIDNTTVTATTGTDGYFSIKLPNKLEVGKKIILTAVDAAKNESKEISTTVREDKSAPKLIAPKMIEIDNIKEKTTIEGQLDEAADLDVLDSSGRSVMESVVNASADNDFKFTVTIPKQPANAKLVFQFTDKQTPKPNIYKKTVTVQDGIAPSIKTLSQLTSSNRLITGTVSEPSTVTATVGGKSIGRVIVKETDKVGEGVYQFKIKLSKYLTEKTLVSIQAKDSAKPKPFVSPVIEGKVVKDTEAPKLEETLLISNAKTSVSGKANKDAKVQLFVGSTLIHSKVVSSDAYGAFKVSIKKQAAGTKVRVVVMNPIDASIKSETIVTVDDYTAPTIKKLETIYDTSKFIKGQVSEQGTVRVRIIGEEPITAVTDSGGNFKVSLPDLLSVGTVIYVSATDKAGNGTKSEKKITVRKDGSAPRLVEPKTIVIYEGDGTIIKGQLNEEATIAVKIGDREMNVTTDENGEFTVTIPAVKYKDTVYFTFKDLNGNQSKKTITVKKK